MEFKEFEDSIVVVHKHRPDALTYAILGVAGEAGEVVEVFKKAMRVVEPDNVADTGFSDELIDEFGDVLWSITKVAHELGVSLETVAQMNMKKLAYRRVHGKGSNDARSRCA